VNGPRTAIGLRSGEGGTTGVVLVLEGGDVHVVRRSPIQLYADGIELAPFHAATEDRPHADAIIDEAVAEAARRADDAVRDLGAGLDVATIGVVLGNGPPPDRALALRSHVASHAAEGALQREALLHAATHTGLPVYAIVEREVFAALATIGGGDHERRLTALGADVGKPWRKPEKLAAAIAWLAAAQA
jgi:hypothetical protein